MKAIVLIKARTGDVQETVQFIRKFRAVKEAYITFGPYDIIVIIEADHLGDIGKMVVEEIQPVPGVDMTLTCLAAEN